MVKIEKVNIRNWVRLIILIMLDAFGMYFFHGYLLLMLMALLVLSPVLSVWAAYRGISSMELQGADQSEDAVRDGAYRLVFILNNHFFLPFLNVGVCFRETNLFTGRPRIYKSVRAKKKYRFLGVFGLSFLKPDIVKAGFIRRKYMLRRREAKHVSYTPRLDVCGNIQVSAFCISLSDYLGLLAFEKETEKTSGIAVFPKSLPSSDFLKLGNKKADGGEAVQYKGGDNADNFQIREYIPGDKLNSIHWKLSAKQHDFMVRESLEEKGADIVIGIELYNNEANVINITLDKAYSLAEECIYMGQRPKLIWWSIERGELVLMEAGNIKELNDCMRALFFEKTYEQCDLLKGRASGNAIIVNDSGE